MKLNKAQELAEQSIYEHTSSTKWQEVKYMKWTTSEMQDVIAKALVKNLSLSGVVGQSEQLVCTYCGINPLKETCQKPKKCYGKEKIPAN
jgi:hypothetical protein